MKTNNLGHLKNVDFQKPKVCVYMVMNETTCTCSGTDINIDIECFPWMKYY